MVIQGANDPRVNKRESDQIVVALRDRGSPVEYIVAPDEGHGFARPINNMSAYAAAEKFLAKYLGGRYQESMTPEISARLKEITVDPKTVTVAKPMDTSTVGLPKPAASLQPGSFLYKTRVEAGGQSMDLVLTTEIKEDPDGWQVTDTMNLPQGEAKDRTTLDKNTLALRKRVVTQGSLSIEFSARDGKVTGEMKMGGQSRPISADLGGELFADGAGNDHVVATLPLAPGYTTTFRNLSVQSLKPRIVQLKVSGSEQITVPAGTFDAFKVELTADDGGHSTIWIAKDSRKVVKSVAVTPPAAGGATVTNELQK